MEKSKFQVVKILDEYTLIINAGAKHNIKSTDEFQILDNEGSEVVDPETHDIIGYLDLIKATVEVSELQDKMCICTSKQRARFGSKTLESINAVNAFSSKIIHAEQEKLNVDLSQVTGGLRKSDSPIQIGDDARLVKVSDK